MILLVGPGRPAVRGHAQVPAGDSVGDAAGVRGVGVAGAEEAAGRGGARAGHQPRAPDGQGGARGELTERSLKKLACFVVGGRGMGNHGYLFRGFCPFMFLAIVLSCKNALPGAHLWLNG